MTQVLVVVTTLIVLGVGAIIYLKYRFNNIPDQQNLEASIDFEVNKSAKKGLSQALVVGVYKDGKSFFQGYGYTDIDQKLAPDESTIFQIGSISKLFTASLLKILCDEGIVTMESTLDELIGKQYSLSPDAKLVTLQQLVTHTSGFPRVPKSLMNIIIQKVGKDKILENPYSYIEFADVINYLKTSKGKRKAGSFKYSNFGMGLLGHILEIVTEKDLEHLAKDKLFAPLDMTSTGIQMTDEMMKSLAQGYSSKGDKAELWTFSAIPGAGAFSSNASDMMKFIHANIVDESSIANTLKSMQHPSTISTVGIGWIQSSPLDKFLGNKTFVWHNGMVGGYASYIGVDQQENIGVVVLSSKSLDVTNLGMILMRKVRTQSWSN